tara:strand:- start:3320 stop:4468 length:1149 start_codon:yes stop_codon:yes gene_type:complete
MPEHGLKILNTSDAIQIDSLYQNYALKYVGYIDKEIGDMPTDTNTTAGSVFGTFAETQGYDVSTWENLPTGKTTMNCGTVGPPLLAIQLKDRDSSRTACTYSCNKGTQHHWSGYLDWNPSTGVTTVNYVMSRHGKYHGVEFAFALFVPADALGEPPDSHGLHIKDGSGDTVFHSGYRYLQIIDHLTFNGSPAFDGTASSVPSATYGADFYDSNSGYKYDWMRSYNAGAILNADEGDDLNSYNPRRGEEVTNTEFHGGRSTCYATYSTTNAPSGIDEDEIWFVMNEGNQMIHEAMGSEYGAVFSQYEWMSITTWMHDHSDKRLYCSAGVLNRNKKNTSTFTGANGLFANPDIRIPVIYIPGSTQFELGNSGFYVTTRFHNRTS